jgi:hypothetical protein
VTHARATNFEKDPHFTLVSVGSDVKAAIRLLNSSRSCQD